MICRQFEQLAPQIAHNEFRDARLLQDAAVHAETCAACQAILVEARQIAATVSSLVAHDKLIEAPAHLESTLRAAFIRQHAADAVPSSSFRMRSARFATSTWAGFVFAAAAIILAIIFLPRLIHRNSAPDVSRQTPVHSTAPAINTAKTAPLPAPAPAPTKRLVAAHPPKKHSAAPEKTLTGFLALPYADDLSTVEYGAIVRMQMSRADLAWFGLPVPVSDNGEKIVADLFVNGSGTPEAIRLVR